MPEAHVLNVARTLIFFPGALGDYLCFWPALLALRLETVDEITIVMRAELFDLLPSDQFNALSIDRREVADLFSTGPLGKDTYRLFSGHTDVHSWTGYGNRIFAQRLRTATGGGVAIHPFRGMQAGEHASRYFARCLRVVPRENRFQPAATAKRWAEDFWRQHDLDTRTMTIHPGSGSRAKNWEGMAGIADMWRRNHLGKVLMIVGPVEEEEKISVPHDTVLCRQTLDRVNAVLQRTHRYLGNDSGITHLAGLVRVRGLALFGPTSPATWHPLGGSLQVVSAPLPCPDCGPQRFCIHRLPVNVVRDRLCGLEAPGSTVVGVSST